MFPAIENLARQIDAAWSSTGYACAAFCDIATEILSQRLDFDFTTLARRLCEGAPLPEQRRLDQGFGQPAITLHRCNQFLIEALCWHTSTPAIHQHAFGGAFRVMTGRSVHSRYSYAEQDRLGRLSLGMLRLVHADVLDGKTAHPIPRGADLIHANFHLDSPTMTVVVRTHQGSEPELSYLPPGVAYDPAARSQTLQKRVELLDTMHQTAHGRYLECVRSALANSDEYDGMTIVLRAGARVDEPQFRELTGQLRNRYGERSAPLVASLVEERRRGAIVRLRSSFTDPDLRFFLAALLSFSSRTDLLHTMTEYYGSAEAARDRIADGTAHLLGGNDDRRMMSAEATHAMLDDIEPEAFPAWLAQRWERVLPDTEANAFAGYYGQVRGHPWLTPLTS